MRLFFVVAFLGLLSSPAFARETNLKCVWIDNSGLSGDYPVKLSSAAPEVSVGRFGKYEARALYPPNPNLDAIMLRIVLPSGAFSDSGATIKNPGDSIIVMTNANDEVVELLCTLESHTK